MPSIGTLPPCPRCGQACLSIKEGTKEPIKGKVLAVSTKSCAYYLKELERDHDYEERKRLVIKYKRCFQCLRNGHQVKDCKKKTMDQVLSYSMLQSKDILRVMEANTNI